MKKLICFIIVLFAFSNCASAYYQLANSRKRGLHLNSIDTILRQKDEQIDIATAALAISRDWGTKKTPISYRRTIDNMANEIISRIEQQSLPYNYNAIPVINKYLFDELGFKSVDTADDPEDLFLHIVMDRKRGYCLSLSILYLSIAERIGLPIYGVVVPGHFFVRYDDGEHRFNIETTSKGNIASDEHYIKKFKPPKVNDSIYMKNLTNKETLGCFFNNLGNSYSMIGEDDYALVELLRAIRLTGNLAEAHTNLGNVYFKKGLTKKAISQYHISVEMLPTDHKIFNNLANAYTRINETSLAIKQYKTAIKLKPDFTDAHRNLAATYYKLGKIDEGINSLKTAANISPDDSRTYRMLGDFYNTSGKYKEAIKEYKKSLTYDPDSPATLINLGYAYLNTNEPAKAGPSFIAALKIDPHIIKPYYGLAAVYGKLGNIDLEIEIYQRLLELWPGDTPALLNLGNAFVSKKEYTNAIEHYLLAIDKDPDNPDVHHNLAVAYLNLEQFSDAAAEYSITVKLDPGNASAHNGLAVCYYILKDLKTAKKHAKFASSLGFSVDKKLLEALK